jgi:hypothetical protein
MTALSADRPSIDPKDDLFGHAPFAKSLADSICRYPGSDGLVLALYGPWGSGKSTVSATSAITLSNSLRMTGLSSCRSTLGGSLDRKTSLALFLDNSKPFCPIRVTSSRNWVTCSVISQRAWAD